MQQTMQEIDIKPWELTDISNQKVIHSIDDLNIAAEKKEQLQKNNELEDLVEELYSAEKFAEAKKQADQVAEKILKVAPHKNRVAEKIGNCYSYGEFKLYEDGSMDWRPYYSCSYSKLCPFHARIEAKRRVKKYLPYILETTKRDKMYFGTLTMGNIKPGQLQDGYEQIWEAWTKFRRSKPWDGLADGYMANLETTWNVEKEEFNLHLHVLVKCYKYDDFDYQKINERWKELTGARWVWWSKPIKPSDLNEFKLAKTLKEIMKYTAKFSGSKNDSGTGGGLLDMTDQAFAEWFHVFHGVRTFRTYAGWYGLPEGEEEEPEEEAAEEEEKQILCSFRFFWDRKQKCLNVYLIQADKLTNEKSKIKRILSDKLAEFEKG